VVRSVLVTQGVTLTIEPGVIVKFEPNLAFQVDGQLIAQGTESKTIIFTSNKAALAPEEALAPGDWGYIQFSDTSVDAVFDDYGNYVSGCIMQYCSVEYGGGTGATGAVYILNSSPYIDHSIIRNNAKTGIYVYGSGSKPKINLNRIEKNSDSSWGGGIMVNSSTATITGNSISQNSVTPSGNGGGIYVLYSTATITGNTISQNSGGGIYVYNSTATITGNSISQNTASYGGGISVFAYSYYYSSTATITGNSISQNTASYGSGISVYNYSTATITGNSISQNTASQSGGGIYVVSSSTATITGNSISQNSALGDGGGISVYNYSTATITGNSIVDNVISQSNGAGIYFYHYQSGGSINSNLIANNKASGGGNSNTIYIGTTPPSSFTRNSLLGDDTAFTIFYDVPHGSDMNAENNFWGTTDSFEILLRIYDFFIDPSKGIVDYTPFLTEPDVSAPPGPPKGLAVAGVGSGTIDLNWQPNLESDLSGYKLYYDFDAPGYPYNGTGLVEGDSPIDVGDVTSFTLSGLAAGMTYYVALTAYDAAGNESWYSKELAIKLGENNPPNTPTNVEPPNGAENISLTPTLKSSVFSDPDPGDVHKASRWQIANMLMDFSAPVFDSGSDTANLTSITVPKGKLCYDAVYYWRVQHKDDDGAWSNFSTPTKFQTILRLLGDVSGNGVISAYDASLILQFVVGLISEFPADMMMSPSGVTPRDYKVSIPRLSVVLGKSIETPIFINDAMGLRAGAFILRYDASVLKPVKVTASPILSRCYWESNLMLGNSASIPARNDEIRIAFAGANPTEGVTSQETYATREGALFYVEFEALPGTDGRQSPIILETVQLSESKDIVKENGWVEILPSKTVLLQNYPNPFNPETWIPFKLAEPADVQLQIYDVRGSLVRTLHLGRKSAGTYTGKDRAAYWDGKDELGQRVASGVYFYCLQAGKFMKTRKLVMQK
jgi:parallel beta-helix repeat protein